MLFERFRFADDSKNRTKKQPAEGAPSDSRGKPSE